MSPAASEPVRSKRALVRERFITAHPRCCFCNGERATTEQDHAPARICFKNKVGPELNGIVGRKMGAVEGFNYSDANKNSGITWNEATFKDYIKDPKAKIPGTKMAFAGIKKETEINDLWAFVSQYDKDGKIKAK